MGKQQKPTASTAKNKIDSTYNAVSKKNTDKINAMSAKIKTMQAKSVPTTAPKKQK